MCGNVTSIDRQNKIVSFSSLNSAYPDVEIHDVDNTWDFILLASDGIWDVLSNDEVVKLCLKKMEKGLQPEQICEEIMTECLSPDLLMTGTDNMTIVLICFLHNKSYWEFCKRAAEYCQRLFPDDEKCENGTQAVISSQQHDELRQCEKDMDDLSSSSDDEPPEKVNEQNGADASIDKEAAAAAASGDSSGTNALPSQQTTTNDGQNNDDNADAEDETTIQESKKFKDQPSDEHIDSAEK